MPTQGKSAGRIEAFRRSHSVGECISGRMLRWEGKGLGLVNIQGREMTALIASTPAPGQVLHFLVERLYPEIVLRELPGIPGSDPSPAMLYTEFRAARTLADEALKSAEAELASLEITEAAVRKKTFHRIAAANQATLSPLLELLAAVSGLNAFLGPAMGARLSSPNWLMPGAYSRELVEFASGRGRPVEVHFFFYIPALGRCEMRLYVKGDKGGLRLFAEEQTNARAAGKMIANISPIIARFDFLGLSPLPPESRAGILARLLSVDMEAPFSFNRRI